jgi:hypothetical protein
MSMVTLSNYYDSLNTFKNHQMNKLLASANSRLILGKVKTNRLPDVLGPLYRFDLNIRKADWLLDQTLQVECFSTCRVNKLYSDYG